MPQERGSSSSRKGSQSPTKIIQFQVVATREGREWTLYGLDEGGELWCRYWKEASLNPKNHLLSGKWGPWMPLIDDTRA